jgi:hypothetical protein
MYGWLAVKRAVFNDASVTPERPEVEFPETVSADPLELAQTANTIAQAEAASKETLVRIIHPDWTEEQVKTEVRMLYAELGTTLLGRARIALAAVPGEPLAEDVEELAEAEHAPSAAQLPETGDIDSTE